MLLLGDVHVRLLQHLCFVLLNVVTQVPHDLLLHFLKSVVFVIKEVRFFFLNPPDHSVRVCLGVGHTGSVHFLCLRVFWVLLELFDVGTTINCR